MRKQLLLAFVIATAMLAQRVEAAEVCGDGIDNDANTLVDEGCYPALTTGQCVCCAPSMCRFVS